MALYSVTREQVAEIYVATFNRAPDTYGLIYWTDNPNLSIEEIAECFFDQPETEDLYPPSVSNKEFVNDIYNNVFNRDADPSGLKYWTSKLESGTVSKGQMIMSIIDGAQGNDQLILDNKTEVGLYFAQNGEGLSVDQAYKVMENVGTEGYTVANALHQIDAWTDNPRYENMDLTTAVDHIDPLDSNSTIRGIVDTSDGSNNTLNAGDIIDGGGGKDTLDVTVTASEKMVSTDIHVSHMTNVETLRIQNCETTCAITGDHPKLADVYFDISGTTGLEDIVIKNMAASIDPGLIIDVGMGNPVDRYFSYQNIILDSSYEGSAKLIDASESIGTVEIRGNVFDKGGATVLGGFNDDIIDLSDASSGGTYIIEGGHGGDRITASDGTDIFKYAIFGDSTLFTAKGGGCALGGCVDIFIGVDKINGFQTGTDKIDFEGMGPADSQNFSKASSRTVGYNAALDAANDDVGNDVFDNNGIKIGTVSTGIAYSYQYDGADGYLFVDVNNDGMVEEAILLEGLDANGFNYGDIA